MLYPVFLVLVLLLCSGSHSHPSTKRFQREIQAESEKNEPEEVPFSYNTPNETLGYRNISGRTFGPQLKLNGSFIVEIVLEFMRKGIQASGFDPIQFPPMSFEFENKSIRIQNGKVNGLSTVQQVGDSLVIVGLMDSKLRTAFGFKNLSVEADLAIEMGTIDYKDGKLNAVVDNITLLQVYKVSYLTQTVTLDVFELSIGTVSVHSEGLGDLLGEGSRLGTEIGNKIKDPILFIFNTVIKGLINAGLATLKAGMMSMMG